LVETFNIVFSEEKTKEMLKRRRGLVLHEEIWREASAMEVEDERRPP